MLLFIGGLFIQNGHQNIGIPWNGRKITWMRFLRFSSFQQLSGRLCILQCRRISKFHIPTIKSTEARISKRYSSVSATFETTKRRTTTTRNWAKVWRAEYYVWGKTAGLKTFKLRQTENRLLLKHYQPDGTYKQVWKAHF